MEFCKSWAFQAQIPSSTWGRVGWGKSEIVCLVQVVYLSCFYTMRGSVLRKEADVMNRVSLHGNWTSWVSFYSLFG